MIPYTPKEKLCKLKHFKVVIIGPLTHACAFGIAANKEDMLKKVTCDLPPDFLLGLISVSEQPPAG